jgi:hypothetical protein
VQEQELKQKPVVNEPPPGRDETRQKTVAPALSRPQADEMVAPVAAVKSESEPQIVGLVHPVFPPEVSALPGGEVVIMVQIDADGKPVKTMVAKSTNPAFNQPIVTAVLRSTFKAGTTASAPATKWLTIPFRVN